MQQKCWVVLRQWKPWPRCSKAAAGDERLTVLAQLSWKTSTSQSDCKKCTAASLMSGPEELLMRTGVFATEIQLAENPSKAGRPFAFRLSQVMALLLWFSGLRAGVVFRPLQSSPPVGTWRVAKSWIPQIDSDFKKALYVFMWYLLACFQKGPRLLRIFLKTEVMTAEGAINYSVTAYLH